MPEVTRTALTTHDVALSTRNKKANVEREVEVNRVTEPAACIIVNRCTPPRFPSSLQKLMEDHVGLDFLLFLYAKLESQLSGSYGGVPQELRMIRIEIAKLTSELISIS